MFLINRIGKIKMIVSIINQNRVIPYKLIIITF